MSDDTPKPGLSKWLIVIPTGVLGLAAALFMLLARYYDFQKARADASRVQDTAPATQPAPLVPISATVPATLPTIKPVPPIEPPTEPAKKTADPTPPVKTDPKLKPGLLVREYPRHKKQVAESEFVDITDLGEPIGEPFVVRNLNEWKYLHTRNAVASGFIKIDKDGEYAFSSDNFYDRNALYVNGKLVCAYRDFEKVAGRIQLKAGMVPFASVGYVGARGFVKVQWHPPWERELVDVPQDVLWHEDAGAKGK